MRWLILILLCSCESFSAERQACVDQTNRYRGTLGKAALSRDAALENFADQGAAEDEGQKSAHYHFIHTENGTAFAENEIPGWLGWTLTQYKTVQGVMTAGLGVMWAEGPGGGHYENMIGDYTRLGCGIAVSGDTVTIVQDYK